MASRLRRSTSTRRASTTLTSPSSSEPVALPTKRNHPPTDPMPAHEGEGMKVSQVLFERCMEVKRVVKSLAVYYEGLENVYLTTAKSYLAISNSPKITYPLRNSVFFLPPSDKTSYVALLGTTKDSAAKQADANAEVGNELHLVVEEVKGVRMDVKNTVKAMEANLKVLEKRVVDERETSTSLLLLLTQSLSTLSVHPLSIPASQDPYILRSSLESQFALQINAENDLTAAVLEWQKKIENEEARWIEKVKRNVARGEGAIATLGGGIGVGNELVVREMADKLSPEAEWSYFVSLNHLLPPTTPLGDHSTISYPHRDDKACVPIKEGILERKKRFMRNWSKAFFVLTPTGYLHEYPSSTSPRNAPSLSLFLPSCGLGSLNEKGKFVIEGRKTPGKIRDTLRLKGGEKGWVYKGENVEVGKSWWGEIEKFTRHPGKSLSDRQGSGPQAVQMIGRPSLDTGSSVEEEHNDANGELIEEAKPKYQEPENGLMLTGPARDEKVKLSGGGLGGGVGGANEGGGKKNVGFDATGPFTSNATPSASTSAPANDSPPFSKLTDASPALTTTTSPEYFVDAATTLGVATPSEAPRNDPLGGESSVSVPKATVERSASVIKEKEKVEGVNGDVNSKGGKAEKKRSKIFGFGKK